MHIECHRFSQLLLSTNRRCFSFLFISSLCILSTIAISTLRSVFLFEQPHTESFQRRQEQHWHRFSYINSIFYMKSYGNCISINVNKVKNGNTEKRKRNFFSASSNTLRTFNRFHSTIETFS